jgi:hypothetical protein
MPFLARTTKMLRLASRVVSQSAILTPDSALELRREKYFPGCLLTRVTRAAEGGDDHTLHVDHVALSRLL